MIISIKHPRSLSELDHVPISQALLRSIALSQFPFFKIPNLIPKLPSSEIDFSRLLQGNSKSASVETPIDPQFSSRTAKSISLIIPLRDIRHLLDNCEKNASGMYRLDLSSSSTLKKRPEEHHQCRAQATRRATDKNLRISRG